MNMNLSRFWETVKFRESYSLQSMESQLDMTANEQKAVEKERNEWIWDSFISSVWYFLYLSWKRWKCSRAEKASLSSFPFNFSQLVSSVTQSDPTLWPHGLQHARFPCPSPTPGACSNSCPSSRWCHPSNSSSVIPFSSCPQSFPASRSFLMSQFFTTGGQSIGPSASASVLPIQAVSFRFDWSLCKPRVSQESSPTPQFKSISSLAISHLYSPTLTSIHDYWKIHSFHYTELCWQSNIFAV